jgi:hypothetical protein
VLLLLRHEKNQFIVAFWLFTYSIPIKKALSNGAISLNKAENKNQSFFMNKHSSRVCLYLATPSNHTIG